MNRVRLALNICTYKRKDYLERNIRKLGESRFFDKADGYFDGLDIFIVDNASELTMETDERIHLFHNPNNGGSGGFQRGIEEIRKQHKYREYTHVIFMDDDVRFEMDCFYILYDFLEKVDGENALRPVAGRMLDVDNPDIQWTAAEKWNGGNIEHIEHLRDISGDDYQPGKVTYDADADYGGFWFCCYPYPYVAENDILPFFLHCDDVEYGLRCGKKPIIIEGVQVWHETWEKKMSPVIRYYDKRNAQIVNDIYRLSVPKNELIAEWLADISAFHARGEYREEYIRIAAFRDYIKWKRKGFTGDAAEKHNRIKSKVDRNRSKYSNTIIWRIVRAEAERIL